MTKTVKIRTYFKPTPGPLERSRAAFDEGALMSAKLLNLRGFLL
jgi:hypothetical protein